MKNELLIFALAMPAMIGCDSTSTGDYRGEKIASIQGTLTGVPTTTPVSANIGLLWFKPLPGENAENGESLLGEGIPVESVFPANFVFDLYSAPDASMIRYPTDADSAGMEYATALILAFDDKNNDGELTVTADQTGITPPDQIIGRAADSVVIYVQTPPSAPVDGIPAQELTPGYHIMRVVDCGDDGGIICTELDDDHSVEIVLTTPSSDFPLP